MGSRSARTFLGIFAALLGLGLTGCAARPFGLATPVGPRAADYFEEFQILGVSDSRAWARTARPAEGLETIRVDAPAGTEFVIPILEGWRLFYGRSESESVEHNIGFAVFSVLPRVWGLPGSPSAPAAVDVDVTGVITDRGSDDDYRAEAQFSFLFLRRATNAYVPAPPGGAAPLALVKQTGSFFKAAGIPDAGAVLNRTETHAFPAVTTRVVPALEGFVLGFGAHAGALSPHIAKPDRPDGRALKEARALARVAPLGAPSGATRNVTVSAEWLLKDADGAEPWYAALDVNALGFAPLADVTAAGQARATIVGFVNRAVELRGREGTHVATETVEVDVPADTQDVIPLLLSWSLSHGEIVQDPDTSTLLWERRDRPFGVGQIGAHLVSLRAGPTPRVRRARVMVSARLQDHELPGNWWANIGLTFLCIRADS